MKVCAYAIMRDEAERVAQWAETTGDADHRVVLDTGSTDRTVDELITHGIDYRHAHFEPFRFDDARNMALALCPPDFDLCLRLDADETLGDDWRSRLEAVYDPHVQRYRYSVVNHGETWGSHTREDCHARFGQRWKYPTHEVLVGPGPTCDVPGMFVHHDSPGRRPHHDTNLVVLAQEFAHNPFDHRMAFYFGRELWYRGQWAACREQMMHFLALPGGWDAERAEAWRILAAIDDDPERWLWKAVGECPARREPWCDLARLQLQQGRGVLAAALVEMAAQRDDDTLYTTQADCWGDAFEDLRDAAGASALGRLYVPHPTHDP